MREADNPEGAAAPLSHAHDLSASSAPLLFEGTEEAASKHHGDLAMTRMQYLLERWREVNALCDQKAAQIYRLTGDASWMRLSGIPGHAIRPIGEWLELCRTLAVLNADIQRERQSQPSEMVLH